MQNSENVFQTPEPRTSEVRNQNSDPREQGQPQEPVYRSYEEGYSGANARDIWNEGEKLRPEIKSERGMGGALLVLLLVGGAFIAGSLVGGNWLGGALHWLTWIIIAGVLLVGIVLIITNWRVVTIPMPTRTFTIAEHARLLINNSSGRVTISQGEQSVITVNATKRASGIGVNPESIMLDYEQLGDILNISTRPIWNFFQFGLRGVDFQITVPANCDVQLSNGSGKVVMSGTRGDIRVRTGSGSIEASDLSGMVNLKTGSGGIRANNLQGKVTVNTGSGRIESYSLRGQVILSTGSGGISIAQSQLTDESRISTGSGGIDFDGAIDARGDLLMKTGSGGITLRLPADTAFSLDARTGSGGVHNEFGSNEVGNQPRAQIKLRTGSGGITIASTGGYSRF